MITTEDIIKISSYFTKIHHTPGRLRVKIDKSILNEVENVSLNDVTFLPKQIEGLKEVKVNKIMATATILYDTSIFSASIWNDLIDAKNLDENTKILNKLQSQIKEEK
ncbi:hypothetical protein [Sulfurimonas sp.]|uniref:hypothetical protein n=1 Tax=Sulfurimonas sp. TaxID=2022749 RepID=UPI0025DCBA69|nr:hypothetical protein [Sulfurimonas sp.]